jgi:hypothetical protein
MESDKLNRWLTLGANLGVLVGLVLVAYEINQSRVQLELATSSDGTDNFTQAMEILVQDEELSELIYRAERSYESLDDFERWRVSKYLDGFMSMSEQDYLVISNMHDKDVAKGFEVDWRENIQLSMYKSYWAHHQSRFGANFRSFIDNILAKSTKE